MPSFTYIAVALALTSAVAATSVQKRDAFSVEQVKHKVLLKKRPWPDCKDPAQVRQGCTGAYSVCR
jgi:hypothetical protein